MTKKIIIWGGLGLVSLIIIFQTLSIYNTDALLRNRFYQKKMERTAFFDKMYKIIKQKGKIAVKNDSSFQNVITGIMSGRKDSEGLMMKWVTEANPAVQFTEVSALYKDLSRTIEAQREGFFVQEKYMQDIKLQDDILLDKLPGGFILRQIFGKQYIEYKPITSDYTDNVMKTGRDNDLEVF